MAEKKNPGEGFLRAPIHTLWEKPEERSTERAAKLLEFLGLANIWDKQASKLSGGQMKLLEIGRALMSGADLLLLDEPISGVNPTLAHEIFGTIEKLSAEFGVTFLIIEHRLDIAHRLRRSRDRNGLRENHLYRSARQGNQRPARDRSLPGCLAC